MASLRNLIGLICLTLTVFNLAASRPNPERRSVGDAYLEDVRKDYECDHATINKTECDQIMSNALLVESHSRLKRMANSDDKEATSCPNFNDTYLDRHDLDAGQRSLSPFTHTVHNDANRIPRYIAQARCLCKGCISPKTLREVRSLKSEPITVQVTVYRRGAGGKWKQSKANITVGCTCTFPARSSR